MNGLFYCLIHTPNAFYSKFLCWTKQIIILFGQIQLEKRKKDCKPVDETKEEQFQSDFVLLLKISLIIYLSVN